MMNSTTHKKKYKNLSLYRKEQLVICVLLLCFGLAAIIFTQFKNQLVPNESNIPEIIVADNDKSDANMEDSNESIVNESTEIESIVNESAETESTDTIVDNAESENNISNNNTSTDAMMEKESSAVSSDTSSPTAPPSSDSSQKIWVPPVYEIIHHEAVYETKRIVICNYCSETFDTVGEFQVHKNANGG